MHRILLSLVLLFTSPLLLSGNDIWQTLFKEKFREATQGNSSAQYDVGSMYQNGRGIAPDLDKAIMWYEKSAAQENPTAVNRLKLLQANKVRFRKILAQANNGDAESQYKLGNMYTRGKGVTIDHARALTAFKKAAEQGFARAEYQLGLNYYEGTGVRVGKKTAYRWFKAAADKGHPAAQYYLGKMFASGKGVKRNYSTSLNWLGKAVDGGFDQARAEIIDVTEQMNALEQDKNTAVENSVAKTSTPVKTPVSRVKKKPARATTAKVAKQKKTTSFSIEDLMVAVWNRNNKPVAYLPSAINNCRTENRNIICYSENQTRQTATNTIRFKTKSTLRNISKDGSFEVHYRNLVINATSTAATIEQEDDGEVGGNGESAGTYYAVQTGWGKEHTLKCNMIDTGTVSCVKNKTHVITLKSPTTVASGK